MRSILEAIPHGVCVYGEDRRVTMFNRAYTQVMTGAPLSIGDHLEDVIRRRAAAGEYGPGDRGRDLRPADGVRRHPPADAQAAAAERHDTGCAHHAAARRRLHQRGDRHHAADRSRGAGVAPRRRVGVHAVQHPPWGHALGTSMAVWSPSNAVAADLLRAAAGTPDAWTDPWEELTETLLCGGHFGRGRHGRGWPARAAGDRSFGAVVSSVDQRAGRVLDIRSDPTPDGGWVNAYRRDGGARRPGRAAPRQGGGGGGEPGQVALPRHDEPRAADPAERGDRLLRRAAARGGQSRRVPGWPSSPPRSTRRAANCSG